MFLLNSILKKHNQITILRLKRCTWIKVLQIDDKNHGWCLTSFRRMALNNYCNTGIAEHYLGNKKQDQDEFNSQIKQLFPNPKATLNVISSRRGHKMFGVSFEKDVGWTCTYSFVWPKVKQFKNICKSKRKASDKAAAQALQWLYNNQHVNPDLIVNKNYDLVANEPTFKENIEQQFYDDSHLNEEYVTTKQLFPNPKETLNTISSRRVNKTFEVSFEEVVEWTCTYSFLWPDVIQFKNTCKSKRGASDKAAEQAIRWLYNNGHIDRKGRLICEKQMEQDLENYSNSLSVEISDVLTEQINKMWNKYNSHIKNIYTETSERNDLLNVMEDSTREDPRIHPVYGDNTRPTDDGLNSQDEMLQSIFNHFDANHKPLPIDGYSQEIISTIETSRVTVVIGEPACGKSTRVPAGILRRYGAGAAALVTQPRRVAAVSVAQRVAEELGQTVGGNIGYQVRLDAVLPRRGGGVLYCTSGIFLNKFVDNPGLKGCTHVVLDEAHERDVNTDLALLLLQRALELNPHLKLIIMSATLDIDIFTRYFANCPVIRVPGRTFPVEIIHLEDLPSHLNITLPGTMYHIESDQNEKPPIYLDEIVSVITAVDKSQPDGAVLVFLPGWADIQKVKLKLEVLDASDSRLIIPVHSRLSNTDQARIFCQPPAGVRKVILSTNIAETSISIPDVVYVVDTGAHKQRSLQRDGNSVSVDTVWVSKAQAQQRTGRAGRLRPGVCYRLYSRKQEAALNDYMNAAILSIPLEELVLKCKSYAPDEKAEQFMSKLPEPPTSRAVDAAIGDLMDIGALTPSEGLTRRGSMLSALGTHPRVGAGLLHAAAAGGLAAAAAAAAYCSDGVDSFCDDALTNEEIREIKTQFSKTSDHMAFHRILNQNQDITEQDDLSQSWHRKCLNWKKLNVDKNLSELLAMNTLNKLFVNEVADHETLNWYSNSEVMTVALLLSGFNRLMTSRKYPSRKGKGRGTLYTSTGKLAHISSTSVNYKVEREIPYSVLLTYFSGLRSEERRAYLVSQTSMVSPLTALIFCMSDVKTVVDSKSRTKNDSAVLCLTKHDLEVEMSTSQADVILKAREMVWGTLNYYIERKQCAVSRDELISLTSFKKELFETIKELLEAQKDYIFEIDKSWTSGSHLVPRDVTTSTVPERAGEAVWDHNYKRDRIDISSSVTTACEAQNNFADEMGRNQKTKQKWWEE